MSNILTFTGFAQDPNIISKSLNIPSDSLDYMPHKFEDLGNLISKEYDSFIGWSLGGQIALKLANKFKIKKLVLIATSFKFVNSENYNLGSSIEDFQHFVEQAKNRPQELLKSFNAYVTSGSNYKLAYQDLGLKREWLLYWLEFLKNFDAAQEECSAEILVIFSDSDPVTNKDQAPLFKEKFKNVELVTLPGSSHTPFLDKNFPAIINNFLS